MVLFRLHFRISYIFTSNYERKSQIFIEESFQSATLFCSFDTALYTFR